MFLSSMVFEIIVEVAFKNIFYLEIHKNNIFFIFKNLFLTLPHYNN